MPRYLVVDWSNEEGESAIYEIDADSPQGAVRRMTSTAALLRVVPIGSELLDNVGRPAFEVHVAPVGSIGALKLIVVEIGP